MITPEQRVIGQENVMECPKCGGEMYYGFKVDGDYVNMALGKYWRCKDCSHVQKRKRWDDEFIAAHTEPEDEALPSEVCKVGDYSLPDTAEDEEITNE